MLQSGDAGFWQGSGHPRAARLEEERAVRVRLRPPQRRHRLCAGRRRSGGRARAARGGQLGGACGGRRRGRRIRVRGFPVCGARDLRPGRRACRHAVRHGGPSQRRLREAGALHAPLARERASRAASGLSWLRGDVP